MRWNEARRRVRGALKHSGKRKMSLGELWEGCAACCVRAPEEREIGRWRLGKEWRVGGRVRCESSKG